MTLNLKNSERCESGLEVGEGSCTCLNKKGHGVKEWNKINKKNRKRV